MYYHASPLQGIQTLKPHSSNHDTPMIYFSTKRENVLVYLSNAVEKYCLETGFTHNGKWQKWASYGFNREGIQRIEEYYPNALADTYKGVSGYIYYAEEIKETDFPLQIPHAAVSKEPVPITFCEYIPDAYEAILEAEKKGLVIIQRYEDATEAQMDWLARTIRQEYEDAIDKPDYRYFLEGKFPSLL